MNSQAISNTDKRVHIKIKDMDYSVVLTTQDNTEGELNNSFGYTDWYKRIIVIDRTLDIIRFKQTLVHELTHAVIKEYTLITQWDEESVCTFVDKYIFDIVDLTKQVLLQINEQTFKETIKKLYGK